MSGDSRAARQRARGRPIAAGALRPRLHGHGAGVGARDVRADEGPVHGLGRGAGAALDAGQREGLGHGGVLHVAGLDPQRASREAAKGKQSGRTQEIQRLIARSLRAVCDLVTLGEVQITVDCDALQADGGTRTASICGAYVALHDACTRLVQAGTIRTNPLTDSVAAVSVGIIDGVPMLDLPYVEDSRAEVDMNVVMTGAGRFVEVQGTAEGMAFTRGELDTLLGLAEGGIKELTGLQAAVLAEAPPRR